MATRSSILAWRIPWTEEPGGVQSMGCKELDSTEHINSCSTVCLCLMPLNATDLICMFKFKGEFDFRG